MSIVKQRSRREVGLGVGVAARRGRACTQTPRRVEPVLTGVVDEDPMPVGVQENRLAPEVRLVDRLLQEAHPGPLELADSAIHVVDLEVDARAGLRRKILDAV